MSTSDGANTDTVRRLACAVPVLPQARLLLETKGVVEMDEDKKKKKGKKGKKPAKD